MGRKKEFKSNNGSTTMTYVNNSDDDEVTVVPVDTMNNIKEEDDDEDSSEDTKCHLCNKILRNKYALKAHMVVHADKNVKCDLCGMMFATDAALTRHKKCKHMDVNLRPFPCTQCELRFLNKSHLATHLKTHTGERDVTCGLCFASFYSKADLVRHMKGRHLNIRSFTCHICNKGFFRKSYLKVHLLNIHMQPTESDVGKAQRCYACRYCQKIFLSRTTCYAHERVHSGGAEQRSLCTMCGKTFSRPSSLKKHMEKHGGTPKFKCEYCERPFFHSSSYKRHLNIHNRPDPDICQVCGTMFTNKDAFRRHLRKHVSRGEMESLPLARDETKICKAQELLSRGEELDTIIKICNMELIKMGSKRDNQIQKNASFEINQMISNANKEKWILQIDELNGTFHCMTQDDLHIKREPVDELSDSPTDLINFESLGYQNNKSYTIVSNEFVSAAKDDVFINFHSSNRFCSGLLSYYYATPVSIYSCKTRHYFSIDEEPLPSSYDSIPQLNAGASSYVSTSSDYNVGTAMLEMYELCDAGIICETYIELVDLTRDIFTISRILERNLTDIIFEAMEITPKNRRSYLNKAFEMYEERICSGGSALGFDYHIQLQFEQNGQLDFSKEKYSKFKVLRDVNTNVKSKQSAVTEDQVEKKIGSTRNSKSRKIRIKTLDNLMEKVSPAKKTNVAFSTFNVSVDEEANSPERMDYDNYDYDDFAPMDYEDEDIKEEKPELEQLEEKVLCEPNVESIKEEFMENEGNKENRRKKKSKKKKKLRNKLKMKKKSYGKSKTKRKAKKDFIKVESDSDYEVKDRKGRPKGSVPLLCTEFICFYCEKHCSTKGTLKTHIATMHMLQRVCSCDVCGMSFISKSRLESHVENVHLRIRRYQCTQCEWAFYARADLDRHERRHTGVKPFMCHLCSKTFVRKAQLKSHLAIHSGERKFMCNHCGKSFITRSTLVTHLKRHTTKTHVRYYKVGGAKREKGVPLICPTCGKILSTAHSLKRHMESVHEKKEKRPLVQKAFPCPQCTASFGYKTSMQRHMHKVHKRYKEPRNCACPICERRLLNESSVLKHMIKRHPYNCDNIEAMHAAINKATQRTIPCPHCKRKFQKQTGLQKHLVKKHYYSSQEYELDGQLVPLLQAPQPLDIYIETEEKPNLLLL